MSVERLPSGSITVLFINTRYRAVSHKWLVNEDGLVNYNDEMISPREVCERFPIDYPMFGVVRGEVCRRVTNEGEGRPYRWIDVERYI